ncbi:MAG: hypothetical protein ACE37F_19475 [Nannocystaceae bacterium]|nr:hypothetical protein [bacterium]
MTVERTFALRVLSPSELSLEGSRVMAIRWQADVVESSLDVRANGGQTILHSRSDEGRLRFFSEPDYPYVILNVAGSERFVDAVSAGCAQDVWTRDELLLKLSQTDPPVSSLLVTVAMFTEVLDHETVEFFVRALESSDITTRKQAVVAISLVPALAFSPALRVVMEAEEDPRLRRMISNVLQMCE